MNIYQYDPTRTLTLRKQFGSEMYNRFGGLNSVCRESILYYDIFREPSGALVVNIPLKIKNLFTPLKSLVLGYNLREKVDAFMAWLRSQERSGILTDWLYRYIEIAYKRGIQRANTELKKAGYKSLPEPVEMVFSRSYHEDTFDFMKLKVYEEMFGILESMNQQVSRVVSLGLELDKEMSPLVKEISDRIEKIGLARARVLSHDEIIRAHHLAMINEYQAKGVREVSVKSEWVTAGDSRVCPYCRSMEGKIFSLEEIRGMIPAHPYCRCVALPR